MKTDLEYIAAVRWIEHRLKKKRIDKDKYYNLLTALVMQRVLKPSAVCIDVGCHRGSILRLMMKYAPNGIFYAFEPLPHFYRALVRTFTGPRMHIHNFALSNAESRSSFNYVISNPGYSGLLKRRYDRPHEEDTQIIVETRLLDDILLEKDTECVSFIKIDVEGAEYLVMEGAQTRIRNDKPVIIFEHGLGGSDCYGKGPEEVFDLLSSRCGLRISLMAEWLTGKPPLNRDSFSDQFYTGRNYYFMAHE